MNDDDLIASANVAAETAQNPAMGMLILMLIARIIELKKG